MTTLLARRGASAGFGRRFAALVYDACLVAGLLIVFTFATLVFTGGHAILRRTAGPWYFLYLAGEICVIAAYYMVNWMRSGQTLGMRAWRLRMVSDTGGPLCMQNAALRLLLAFLAWTPVALGVVWLYFDPEQLTLQDRFSKTRVLLLTRS